MFRTTSFLSEPSLRSAVSVDERPESPSVGVPLGAALGLTISLLVALLLGGLTAVQLHREGRRERSTRETLLAESLAPLVGPVEEARSLGEIEGLLSSSRLAGASMGRADYDVEFNDTHGRTLASSEPGGRSSHPADALRASVAVTTNAITSGTGSLVVWRDGSDLAAEMALRRREALFDIGVTVLAVIFVVQLSISLFVSRPLRRLLTAIEKFEQGYPAGFRNGFFARELRSLEWRLERMSVGLTRSARLLVAAHRKAMAAAEARQNEKLDPLRFDPLTSDHADSASESEIVRRYLSDRCAYLEQRIPGDPTLRDIAVEVWENDASEAERLGESHLRTRLEDSALAILDPDALDRVRRDLKTLVASRASWCATTTQAVASALEVEGIPCVEIQHRVKHAAGIWRKMQEKHLSIEEVHDVLAFRIIVPEPDHCYLALDAVHRLLEPKPFRFKDYIANPKANGYQSLHTSVRDRDGFVFEVQIRSREMHRTAENGTAAHWRYRAETTKASAIVATITLRGLRRWLRARSHPFSLVGKLHERLPPPTQYRTPDGATNPLRSGTDTGEKSGLSVDTRL